MGKRIKVRVGDVFRIETSLGRCYGLVTNTHIKWKFVIAVFRKFFTEDPVDYSFMSTLEPQFRTIFLIQDAARQDLVEVVGHIDVPENLKEFPVFRKSHDHKNFRPPWFFWDGEMQWRVDRPLSDEEKKYPRGPSLPSFPLLVEWIEKDYRVERDYVPRE